MALDITTIDWPRFGDLIRARRIEKRFSQSQVADELGISQPSVSMTERGYPVGISADNLTLLLSLLGIATSEVPTAAPSKPKSGKTNLFLSYSHKDKEYLDRLLVHLRPLEKQGLVNPWNDTRLQGGDKWKQEIDKALKVAAAALFLVSADFLASDFIVDHELQPLLAKADRDGTIILPLIVKPCGFSRDKSLSIYQAINSPDAPLSGMTEHGRETVYDSAAARIQKLIGRPK